MQKIKIKLIQLGFLPHKIDLVKIKAHKSILFEIVGDCDFLQLENTQNGYNYCTYEDSHLNTLLPKPSANEDFVFAITNYNLENNFYARRLTDKRAILSLREISGYLRRDNIPLENLILKMIYEYSLGFDKKTNNFDMKMLHDETRCCIFDMNGILEDVIFSCNAPSICDACRAILKKKSFPINILNNVEKELKKLKKPLFYRMLGWIKIHPVYSILISSVYAIFLGILSSYLFSLF